MILPADWAWRPSPNFRPRKAPITAIVLHADAASRITQSMDWVRRAESGVSYHVMVGRTGDVYCCVNPSDVAWHAGESALDGVKFCNSYSVGVCLSNRNDGVEKYPDAQVQAAVDVCVRLCRHYGIPVSRIVTHAQVATPPGRKTDPKGLDVDAFRAAVAARVEG